MSVRVRLLLLAALAACEPAVQPAAASAPPVAPPAAPPAPAPAPPAAPAPAVAPVSTPYRQLAGLEYVEVVTGEADPEARLPLIVAIHGLGDRPDRFAALLDGFPGAARIILPRGLDVLDEGGFSWFPIRARSPDVAGLAGGIARAGDALVPFVRELVAARPTLGKPVVTGFSQGGMLSFYLATRAPDLFAAAFPVGGWLPPPLWPRSKPEGAPPIFALHGAADNAVKLAPTEQAVAHLQGLGWNARLKAWPDVGHAIPPTMRRELHQRIETALRSP
nr:alpha/beta hydrolase [Nannocystis pusilla]